MFSFGVCHSGKYVSAAAGDCRKLKWSCLLSVDPWCYAHEIIDLNFTIIQQSSNDLSYP